MFASKPLNIDSIASPERLVENKNNIEQLLYRDGLHISLSSPPPHPVFDPKELASLSVVALDRDPTMGGVTAPMLMRLRSAMALRGRSNRVPLEIDHPVRTLRE